jgi:argininosuccinate lyase
MTRIKEKVIEEIKLLPQDVLESVADFVEYLKIHRRRTEELELKYGSLEKLESKVRSEEHTWEEEKDFFEWEAALTEVKKIKRILKVD